VEPVHPGTKFLSTTLVTSVPDPDPPDTDPPDPHVFGPYGSGSISQRILLSLSKNSKKTLDFYSFVTSFWHFIFENLCKITVPTKSIMQKNFFSNSFFVGILKVNDENRRIRIRIRIRIHQSEA
jgi:hypothetical protein